MKSSLKVTHASAWANGIVAGTGALLGGIFIHRLGYHWLIGAIIGMVFGYLFRDPISLWRHAKSAYISTINWRPNKRYWVSAWLSGVAFTCFVADILIFTTIILTLHGDTFAFSDWRHLEPSQWFIIKFIIAICILAFAFNSIISFPEGEEKTGRQRKLNADLIKNINPVTFYLYWPIYGVYLAISKIPIWVPASLKFTIYVTGEFLEWVGYTSENIASGTALFIIKFLSLIHSEARVVCALDVFIGTIVGYIVGHEVVYFVAGLTIGIIHEYVRGTALIYLNKATAHLS